jgi:hypothetical protein
MQFDTLRIIDIKVLFLSDGKHVLILQKMNISNELPCLKFTKKVFLFPIQQSNMAFLGSHDQVLPIPREINRLIWAEVIKIKIKNGLRVLNAYHLFHFRLLNFQSSFSLVIRINFQITGFFCIEIISLLLQSKLCLISHYFSSLKLGSHLLIR